MDIQEQIKMLDTICPETLSKKGKYHIRRDFFENIQTEIQAYLLGFFVADGCICDTKGTISIIAFEIDREIIENYKQFVSSDNRILNINGIPCGKNKKYKSKPALKINISSVKLISDLNNLGYTARKTYKNLNIPQLNEELTWHFIRGYFDGDGCAACQIKKPDVKYGKKNYRVIIAIDITSKTSQILDELKQYLEKYDIVSNVTYITNRDCYRFFIGAKASAKKFIKLMYNDAHLYLSRKKNKFDHYVNTEETQLIAEFCNA